MRKSKIILGALALITLSLVSVTVVGGQCPPGMVSYWKFDEGSGRTAYDAVNGNHGTIYGATWTTGKVHGALNFDGNDYVGIESSSNLEITDEITVEAWFKLVSTAASYFNIVDKMGPSLYEGYRLAFAGAGFWDPNSYLCFAIDHANSADPLRRVTYVMAPNVVQIGAWHHAAGTYDGTELRLYLDGVLVGSKPATGPITPSSDPLYFGRNVYGWYWNGLIDEVAIYNRALSAEEIQQHYHNGLCGWGYCAPVGLIAYFSGTPTSGWEPLIVSFKDQSISDEGIVSWYWQFGDGKTSEDQNPTHTYAQAGRYTVSLTVTEADGDSYTETKTDYIIVGCPPSMVSYWKFDEGSGQTAYDAVSGNRGTIYGATWTTGIVNGALSFDGVNDYVEVPDSPDLDISGEITVEAWIKTTKTNSGYIIDKRWPHINYRFGMSNEGKIWFSTKDWIWLPGNTLINDGSWHHVVGVKDSDGLLHVYVDGVEDATPIASGGTDLNDDPVKIGIFRSRGGSLSAAWQGQIDEVAIYKRALTAEKIQQHYQNGLCGLGYCQAGKEPPIANAGPDQTLLVGESVNFDGSGSSDPDGTIVSYEWDFDAGVDSDGDGDPTNDADATGVTASHIYANAGTYTVTLTVTDDDGATGTDTATITVQTPAQATEDLITTVESLELAQGVENSLKAPLEAAIDALERGNDKAAIGQLNAFINHVEAQRGKKLSEEEADSLIETAERIIASIESSPAAPVAKIVLAPRVFTLHQNYPNPFNSETNISFSIKEAGHITLTIYNTLGQPVRSLVEDIWGPGHYTVRWDGKDDRGAEVSGGVYVYRIVAGKYSEAKKMILLR